MVCLDVTFKPHEKLFCKQVPCSTYLLFYSFFNCIQYVYLQRTTHANHSMVRCFVCSTHMYIVSLLQTGRERTHTYIFSLSRVNLPSSGRFISTQLLMMHNSSERLNLGLLLQPIVKTKTHTPRLPLSDATPPC